MTDASRGRAQRAGPLERPKPVPMLPANRLAQLLKLIKGADSVELKVSVPDANRRSAVSALGMDPLEAQIRQVVFFDTPDLALNRCGVVVRARRIQRKPGDLVVKLRPVVPDQLPVALRESPNFGVEVDAMPGGFVCSASMKAELDPAHIKQVQAGNRPIRKLFTKEQRAFLRASAPEDLQLDTLAILGPINVLKLKFTPAEYGRRLVAELWTYPDGSRILELSTKCIPAEALDVAGDTKVFLAERGIDLLGEQQTKTRTALEFFSNELADATPGG
jgi:hypothetical protein